MSLVKFLMGVALCTCHSRANPQQRESPVWKTALRDAPIAGVWTEYLDSDLEWTATSDIAVIEASVPGDIVSDLHNAGFIGNPLYEMNFLNATMWDRDWEYSYTFPTGEHDNVDDILLVFDGIKMGANITLNGHVLGQATDQFLRYQFPVKALLKPVGSGDNVLRVIFSADIKCDGRWMACSGGWDWAPYTTTKQEGARTFTKGIWKSVYLVGVSGAAITHLAPHVFYNGPYVIEPLTETTKSDFSVSVRVHVWSAVPCAACEIAVTGAWHQGSLATTRTVVRAVLPAGNSNITVTLQAPSAAVQLWYVNDREFKTWSLVVSFFIQVKL